VLAVFVIACLLGLVVYFGSSHNGDTSSSAVCLESKSVAEQQAWQIAAKVVGASKEGQERFVTELLDLYCKVKDSDLVIFCIPGGWGKKPLENDVQGRSWLVGMEAEMTKLGYRYCEVDDIRTGNGLFAYLFELKEQLTHYPSKAKELAAKIDFLTQQVKGLKVVITGQSFWHRVAKASRSLVIDNNGIGADALTDRDIVSLVKVNLVKIFIINNAPSFTPIDWVITRAILVFWPYNFGLGLRAPGHEYMWDYPGVGPVIERFLVNNFAQK
jgi:hypothetical protein